MRHLNIGRQLGRNSAHRLALMKNLLSSLIEHERITTTLPKAKELRRYADQFVTLGKAGTLSARRQAYEWIRQPKHLSKLFSDVALRYPDKQGGYTRITKLGPRLGDQAEMALIEYLPGKSVTPAKVEDKGKSKAKTAKSEKTKETSKKDVKQAAKKAAKRR